MKPNEMIVTVKPSKYRNMVKHFLGMAGFTCSGSGYMLCDDAGDLFLTPPPGASPDEFQPAPLDSNYQQDLTEPGKE